MPNIYMVFQAGTNAATPQTADQSLAPWFNRLSATDGTPCCSIADCWHTMSRVAADVYETLIDDTWVAVPPDGILSKTINPTGLLRLTSPALVCSVRS